MRFIAAVKSPSNNEFYTCSKQQNHENIGLFARWNAAGAVLWGRATTHGCIGGGIAVSPNNNHVLVLMNDVSRTVLV